MGARLYLSANALAALGAATRENLTALLGRHARAETVAARTDKTARLISAFHGFVPLKSGVYSGLGHFCQSLCLGFINL